MNYTNRPKIDAQTVYAACRSTNLVEREEAYHALHDYLERQLDLSPILYYRLSALEEQMSDCLQEALLAIWQQIEDSTGPHQPEHFLAWATRILFNKVVDLNRREGYRAINWARSKPGGQTGRVSHRSSPKRLPLNCKISLDSLYESAQDETVPAAERLADTVDRNPAVIVERQTLLRETMQTIFAATDLNASEKAVLHGWYLEEKNDQELAAYLEKTLSTIRVTRKRAVDKLRSHLALNEQVAQFFVL